jgi:ribosomal protein L32
MVVRMRHTRAHTRNRRAHHKLQAPSVTKEKGSEVIRLRHRASAVTGTYRGKTVSSIAKKLDKKVKKASKK